MVAAVESFPSGRRESPMLDKIGDSAVRERVVSAQEWLNTLYTKLASWPKVKAYLRTSYTEAALSGFGNGTYTGNALNLTIMIEAVRDDEEESARGFAPQYVETSIARRLRRAIRLTRARGDLGLFSTASGMGKSTALRALAAADAKQYIYLFINATHARGLWPVLSDLLKSLDDGGTNAQVPSVCYKRLRDALELRRLTILLDDAHHLDAKTLDVLRSLSEESRTPIFFAGNPTLYEFGFLKGSNPAAFTQFASRCLVQEHLTAADVVKADVQLIAGQLLGDELLGTRTDGKSTLVDDLWRAAKQQGTLRRLKSILQRTHERARGRTPTVEQVLASIEDVNVQRGGV